MESNQPVIQSQVWHVAKDTAFAAEYEDAFSVQLRDGRAAIADGVSSAIFSGRWARILTRRAVEDPPDLSLPDAWINWLAEPRRLWLEEIDFPRMPVHQKQKLRQVGGSFCTLCWVELYAIPYAEGETPRCLLRSFALGDSCLLHIRSGKLLRSFPLTKVEEFDLDPDSICSVAGSRDGRQPLASIEFECLEGDSIVLVTDAIAKWMLSRVESGETTPWEQLWVLTEAEWVNAIERLRDTNIMKRDDTTMIVLKVGEGVPPWSRPDPVVEDRVELLPIESQDPGDLEAGINSEAVSPALTVVPADDGFEFKELEDGEVAGECEIDECSERHIETTSGVIATVVSETVSPQCDENSEPMGA